MKNRKIFFEESSRDYRFGPRGKQLRVREWGDPQNPTLLLVHGFPGCADHGKLMSGSPYWKSIRLIAVDRPGYGDSDPQPNITPIDFAEQITALLNQNKIHHFSIISVSGGAPYSMAIAYRLPDRVLKISSIGGVAPLTPLNFFFMNKRQMQTWFMRRFVPDQILSTAMKLGWKKNIEKMEKLFFTGLNDFSEPDRFVLQHPELGPELFRTMKEAIDKGPHGILADMKVYSKPWGYSLKDVKCPVTLWHGLDDDVVHFRFAQDMSYRLPKAQRRFVKNEGHYSILLNQRDEILKDIIS